MLESLYCIVPEGFHVTRCPLEYQEGMVFELQPVQKLGMYQLFWHEGIRNESLHLRDYEVVKARYPRGLSPHGVRYLLFPPEGTSVTVERELEACRQQYSPDQPSRYESYFAWPSEEAARTWMTEQAAKDRPSALLRIECDEAIPRQQELINHYFQLQAQGIVACHDYWQNTEQAGRIELQMPGSITVAEVIEPWPAG